MNPVRASFRSSAYGRLSHLLYYDRGTDNACSVEWLNPIQRPFRDDSVGVARIPAAVRVDRLNPIRSLSRSW
jgi:hypothetical protein